MSQFSMAAQAAHYPTATNEQRVPEANHGQLAYPDQIMPPTTAQQLVEPAKYCGVRGNYRYELVIEQQPIRARMCGFGDKDRRPITPPPCVRVVVRDCTTGKEVPAADIDPTFFILSVDLWDENATQEKNVVRTSSNTPAVTISTATTTSFPPQPERQQIFTTAQAMAYPNQQYQMIASPQQPQGMFSSAQQSLPPIYAANGPPGYYGPGPQRYPQSPYGAEATSAVSPAFSAGYTPQAAHPPSSWTAQSPSGQGMYTRNLIGSLTVNAFTLKDDQDRLGVWFVLQDLSVRTEAAFRLKMNFIDIGTHSDPVDKSSSNKLNPGKSPVLASVFSQPFQVFSAKKFPGVIESTPLSKCFAAQGIKIPIRKDGAKGEIKDEDD